MKKRHKLRKLRTTVFCILAFLILLVIFEKNITLSSNSASQQVVEEKVVSKDEEVLVEDKQEAENDAIKNNDQKKIGTKVDGKIVYLTFDDGPTANSDEILDILDEFNAKATFFMLEPAMRKYPKALNRIVGEGHGVGLHGVTHDIHKFYQSPQSALKEMKDAQKTLLNITGVKTNLTRTPYGSIPYLTNSFREVFKDNNLLIWDWNVDSSDWSSSNKDYVQNVINQLNQLNESNQAPIILMHDRNGTASNLSNLLIYLQKNDYQTEIIDESVEAFSFQCHDRCYSVN